ncbi:MAG: hypothetical protein ACD_33C00045G0016 [uncultured bacterium]|nr:MAG: hypothetical protein ACD_33C00045G0016 [uncultured bacterium]
MDMFEKLKNMLKNNKDSDTIVFLESIVNKFSNVVRAIDKVLKKKGIDVGEAFEAGKEKVSYGSKFIKELGKIGLGGIKGSKLFNKGKEITATIKDKLARNEETDTGPPEETTEDNTDDNKDKTKTKDKSIIDLPKKPNILTKTKDKFTSLLNIFSGKDKETTEDKIEEDKDRTTKAIEEANKDAEERKAEVESEKDKAKIKPKDKGKGWLSKILGMVPMIVGGITTAIKWVGGFLFKGLTSTLFSLVPKLSGGIASALSGLIGGGIKGLVKGAFGLAKQGAKAALPFLGKAALTVGRAGLAVASGPVGWAVLAGTAIYAGYKLYKYLNRNDVESNDAGNLTRYRLMLYGYDDTKQKDFSKIFDLEMMFKELIQFKNGKLIIKRLDKETKQKILDIFEITQGAYYKEKIDKMNTWLGQRFLPIFNVYVQTLKQIRSNLFLDELELLKPIEMIDFLNRLVIDNRVYEVTETPSWSDGKIHVTQEEIIQFKTKIYDTINKKVNENKPKDIKKFDDQKKKTDQVPKSKGQELYNKAINKPKDIKNPTNNIKSEDINDGEKEPKVPSSNMSNAQKKVSSKLKMASGDLVQGNDSLDGIKLVNLKKEKIYNLDPNVKELFTGMAKEYNEITGKEIPTTEAFREREEQEKLYRNNPDKAAKPGNSTHEFGLAIDIDSKTADELEEKGLMKKYGFTRPIGKEKWHLENIGVSINPNESKHNEIFRTDAIINSVLKGGGGYGTEDDSLKKKRDIPTQLAIFNSPNTEIVNPTDTSVNKPVMTKTTYVPSNKQIVTSSNSNIKSAIFNTRKEQYIVQDKPELPEKKKEIISPKFNDKPVVKNETTNIGKYSSLNAQEAIKEASALVGIDKSTMLEFNKLESNSRDSKSNTLFEFSDSKWKELIDKYSNRYNIPKDADKNNNFYNAVITAAYAKDNLNKINKDYKKLGVTESSAIYMANKFGVEKANELITGMSSDNKEITDIDEKVIIPNIKTITKDNISKEFKSINNAVKNNVIPTSINNTSMYSIKKPVDTKQAQVPNNIFNTDNMELIMKDQLTSLNTIVSVLNSIHDKIDLEKLGSLISSTNNNIPKMEQKPNKLNTPSNSGVNLRRANI